MSKNIADLYNEVMNSQAAAAEKTASASGNETAFDRTFFEKVASGDEDSVTTLNAFIDEARAEGHSDDQIEAAIGEAMTEAGIDASQVAEASQGDDEFEMAKAAAYDEGVTEAYEHVMTDENVKAAGITEDDLVQYHLGLAKGQGYAETRAALEDVVVKIAEAKQAGVREAAKSTKDFIVRSAKRYGNLMAGGAKGEFGEMAGRRAGNAAILSNVFGKGGMRGEALKSLAARAGTAGAVGGAGYAATRKKK